MRNKPTILFDDPCDIEEDDEDNDILGWREEEEDRDENLWEEEYFDSSEDGETIFSADMAQLPDGEF